MALMKRPAFQFYPADWRKDAALQSCSLCSRGLWAEMMCIMHECDPYGTLSVNGKPMGAPQLSRLVGESEKGVKKLLQELEDAGVFSRDSEGRIYSRRMVKDEYVRNIRAEGGKAGSEHGAKGAEHGKKGGRPPKNKGGFETPLAGDEEPPPSTTSSSSSSTSMGSNTVRSEVEVGGTNVHPIRAAQLTRVMREFSIDTSPADPRIVALAEQGVLPETVKAACEAAKKSKPNERVAAGYIVSIIERWAAEASNLKASGAKAPSGGKAQKFDPVAYVNKNRASNDHERPDDYIDV
jgi:hypothetical protein